MSAAGEKLRRALSTAGVAMLVAVGSYALSGVLVAPHPAFALSAAKNFSITSTVYATTCTKTATAKLYPGVARCLAVSVHDPLSVGIHVTSLTATLTPSTPFSPVTTTSKLAKCTPSWLTLGTLPHTFTIPAGGTDVVTTTIELTTTRTNQDNCEGGTFHLAYSGSATFTDTTTTALTITGSRHQRTLHATVTPGNPSSDPYGPGTTTAPVHHVVFYACTTASCTTRSMLATATLSTTTPTTKVATASTKVTGLSAGTHTFEAVYPATAENPGTFAGSSGFASTTVAAAPTSLPPPPAPPGARFSVKKTDTPGTGKPVVAGGTIGYTLSAKDVGTAPGTATISDPLPTNVTLSGTPACATVAAGDTCAVTATGSTLTMTVDLAAGDSAKADFDAVVSASDTASVTNTATITQGACTADACTSSVTNPVVVLSVAKSSTPPSGSVVSHTARLTYTLTATDSGTAPTTPLTLRDTVPAGTTYVAGSATCGGQPGCSVTEATGTITWSGVVVQPGTANALSLSFAVIVERTDTTGEKIANTATFSNDGTSTCTTSRCATDTVTAVVTAKKSAATHAPPPVSPIPSATTPHTGEPFAGSFPYELAGIVLGLGLLGAGEWLRRRRRAPAQGSR
ncbi:MAG: hypothetical protein M0Z46_02070 [Actinomycetota bacterium]|nr:hypothetical protein [Actinomycetota bacterium]